MIKQIPGFLGGKASSSYDKPENQTFSTARDLNIFGENNVLTSQTKLVNDVFDKPNFKPFNSYLASNGNFYFLGAETISGSDYTILYTSNTSLGTGDSLTEVWKDVGIINRFPLEEFKGSLWFGMVSAANLVKYASFTGTPSASPASITNGVDLLRVHPGLGKLFYVHNSQQIIGWTDDTTYVDTALVVGANDRIISIEPYGQFLLVGVKDTNGSKPSRILIWDGAATTVDDLMVMSTPNLQAFRVIGSTIRAIVADVRSLSIYEGPVGGTLQPVYSIKNPSTSGTPEINTEAMAVNNDILYFGFKSVFSFNPPVFSLDQGVWAYGSEQNNKPNRLNLDRLISTGATSNIAITSIRNDGSNLIITWNDTNDGGHYYLNHNYNSQRSASANGVYETTRFRLDPYRKSKLKWLKIFHKPLPANTGFTVKVIHFGAYEKGDTPPAIETFTSASAITQNTANSTFTLIKDGELAFKYCDEIQIQIALNTVSGTNAPEIIFPILYETEELD